MLFSTIWYGHSNPLSKIAELLTDSLSNADVKLISVQLLRGRLSKEFKTVNYEYLYPQHTSEHQQKLDSGDIKALFAYTFSQFDDYLENRKDLPDLIIADMFAVTPMKFAKKHGIPLIIMFPESYGAVQNLFSLISLNRSFNIEGFLVNTTLEKDAFFDTFDAVIDAARGHARIIFQSFIGLDDPCIMPPNHTLVGLLPNRSNSELTPELKQWIEGWKAKGKTKFLYVSFGIILKLSLNFAKKLADAFVKLGYPTIWSLRASGAEQIEDPLIFHGSWLPQEAILRLPEVRGYMTHCGWGSITEAIMTKTPLICVPGFADQPANAELVSNRKIGKIIYQTSNYLVAAEYEVDLSSERICTGVSEVLEDEAYYKSIERLNRMSSLIGQLKTFAAQ